ncbi:nucleotide sugar dehydrogenase [Egbenema bharatensis]|uniref:nucleotide sugar dehydrogenase n=1 Tax=Egbenema bharatensis TaxID=3463334 RepID=UPI003A84FADF
MNESIAVIGLGYVGLPVALAFAQKYPHTIGFDINPERVEALRQGIDRTGEVSAEALLNSRLQITADLSDLVDSSFFVVAVPTPIDRSHRPDLTLLAKASELVGKVLKPGAVVVYESTVYPGVTEEFCGPILANVSGLRQGVDFKLGYSPERINPGDKEHTLEKIVKVVAGENEATLERVAQVYGRIIAAGIHRATSIRVAEMAKAIENTQRDLNIALMNEVALICDRLNIRTYDVLQAARTKWNFLPFTPGLVGGHCIGVDPYYLTAKAEELGLHPEVILAGRRINDGMGEYIAQRLVKLLISANLAIRGARVGVLGLTFKENVPDIRNSRVPDIIRELQQFGIQTIVHDPLADPDEVQREYQIQLADWQDLTALDAIVLAVGHQYYLNKSQTRLLNCLRSNGVVIDVKSILSPTALPANVGYWSV